MTGGVSEELDFDVQLQLVEGVPECLSLSNATFDHQIGEELLDGERLSTASAAVDGYRKHRRRGRRAGSHVRAHQLKTLGKHIAKMQTKWMRLKLQVELDRLRATRRWHWSYHVAITAATPNQGQPSLVIGSPSLALFFRSQAVFSYSVVFLHFSEITYNDQTGIPIPNSLS